MNPHFEYLGAQKISALNIEVERYRHRTTGAQHVHLVADDTNNAFAVAFLTVPSDSMGVAHILEHTVLCGSERYPVRDPFFMMIKRSLNTFMNAFTASDWTAYPFASQNRKDFDNLLGVYLDAVFFPTLDRLDFAQEGHRLEPAERGNADADLELKGVVYNEMKGAMSPPVAQVQQALQSALFPTITYHHNSGGDPERIPDLTHEALRAFHAKHYHPSNATFLTYGNFPVGEHQSQIHDLALARFEHLDIDLHVPDERRFDTPQVVNTTYALDPSQVDGNQAHVLVGWLLGKNEDARERLRAQLLGGVLMNHSGSPLQAALETTELGTSPSELCGLDDSTRECTFSVGLEGCDPANAEAIEAMILDVVRDVAENGVADGEVAATLHQLELAQREIGGDHFPYGLGLMIKAMEPALHGGDPVSALDLESPLAELAKDAEQPGFINALARELLLDNPHRVRLTATPDTGLAERREAELKERLGALRDALSPAAREKIAADAVELEARQESEPDAELLPKVGIEDVPADIRIPQGVETSIGASPATVYRAGTNGLVYARLVTPLSVLSEAQLEYLPLFCDVLAEVGAADRDYRHNQAFQAAVVGGVDANYSIRGQIDDISAVDGYFVLAGKALRRNQHHLSQILADTLASPRFDEPARLRELVAQQRAQDESRITDMGHSLAMTAAGASLSPAGAMNERWSGLSSVRSLKQLDAALGKTSAVDDLAAMLTGIASTLAQTGRTIAAVCEEEAEQEFSEALGRAFTPLAANAPDASAAMSNASLLAPANVAWLVNSQVNFCARAFPAVPQGHDDAAALFVLANLMRNDFLHRELREKGGAYGGGASFDASTGIFGFFSYRDPRLSGTLSDFERAIEWAALGAGNDTFREQAILGVVSAMDRPGSPAGEALSAFMGNLHGRTPQRRRAMRARVLGVDANALRGVIDRYLAGAKGVTAVVTSERNLDADEGGLDLERIML